VYVRGSRDLSVRVVGARTALEQPVSLSGGAPERLSDHAAVVVEFELSRCTNCAPVPRVTSATRDAALASLERAADITPFRVALSLLTALALVVLGMGWKRRIGKFTEGPRRRVALRLVALSLLGAAFVWTAYLGAFYYPTRAKALREVARELGSTVKR
jgi:hypothetical protein